MNLTPFGFVSRAETFVKEALSLPPRGGGEWTTQRLVNFMDHTGSLHILLDPGTGVAKPSAILRSRITGGPRDTGIQGWVEYPPTDSREAFVLRETDAERAMEEIFDIVEKVLSRIPEWDNSGMLQRPEPAPRVFEPLIPEIQKPASAEAPIEAPGEPTTPPADSSEIAPEAAATVANFPDTQSFVDSLLSPETFEAPPSEAGEPAPESNVEPETPAEPVIAEEPSAEEPPKEEPAAEDSAKPAKKPGRAKKAKA